MAGVDVGGTTDGQLDIEEFKLLMMFLKVILCKGHPMLTKLGIEGPMMTVDTWGHLLVNLKAVKEDVDKHFGARIASETELSDEDSDDDDSDETGSDGETDCESGTFDCSVLMSHALNALGVGLLQMTLRFRSTDGVP